MIDNRPATGRAQLLALTIFLVVFASALRFYRLGDWPFSGDEVATLMENDALFRAADAPADQRIARLPRIVPLAHLVHYVGYSLFGRDEFGSRVAMALIGSVSVVLIFLLVDGLLGRSTALATSLLVALWPHHLFASQENRFYITAALFSFLCLLLGGHALRRRSAALAAATCVAAVAAILCHTVTGALLGIVPAAIVLGAVAERRSLPKSMVLLFVLTGLAAAGFLLWYVRPQGGGWNVGASWGYSVKHSLLGSASMIRWPVACLAAFGAVLAARNRTPQNWYWLTCAVGFVLASALLPLLVVYHPAYVFPLALGAMVLAGHAVATVYDLIPAPWRATRWSWLAAACLLVAPGVASHYVDGSRYDYRTAAGYLEQQWSPGDCVVTSSVRAFGYYTAKCRPVYSAARNLPARIEALSAEHKTVWVVVASGRRGLPRRWSRWLGTHSAHELQVQKRRFDYYQYTVHVYRFRR